MGGCVLQFSHPKLKLRKTVRVNNTFNLSICKTNSNNLLGSWTCVNSGCHYMAFEQPNYCLPLYRQTLISVHLMSLIRKFDRTMKKCTELYYYMTCTFWIATLFKYSKFLLKLSRKFTKHRLPKAPGIHQKRYSKSIIYTK